MWKFRKSINSKLDRPGFLSKSTLASELSYNIWLDRVLAFPPPTKSFCKVFFRAEIRVANSDLATLMSPNRMSKRFSARKCFRDFFRFVDRLHLEDYVSNWSCR
jgi:hypothetical protein